MGVLTGEKYGKGKLPFPYVQARRFMKSQYPFLIDTVAPPIILKTIIISSHRSFPNMDQPFNPLFISHLTNAYR